MSLNEMILIDFNFKKWVSLFKMKMLEIPADEIGIGNNPRCSVDVKQSLMVRGFHGAQTRPSTHTHMTTSIDFSISSLVYF